VGGGCAGAPYGPATDMQPAAPEMAMDDVLWFLAFMDDAGVEVWLDGGWAVDACLGEQTRRHGDVDIAIEEHHVPAAVAALTRHGFAPVPRDDTCAWNFVLGDRVGRQIDFHVVALAEDGRGVYGPPENGEFYSANALTGTGTVGGRQVRCIAPQSLVAFHTGYEVDADDWADVRALCERFDIPIPEDYRRFR
jgi:lincosamide nucleotidyltransferase A/C/D/E